ncbi:MAG TPA: peptidylprolyl isomerase [Chitinophagales bacterium]|nr:peptidylprolyl isomerase [Chitinophagales bacterium]
MAFIMDIRQKFGPILVIIIGLSLAIFVLQTAFESNTSLLTGSRDVVGEIDGEKIHYNDYMTRVAETEETYRLNQNQPITDNVRYSLREQAWNQMIQDRISTDMYDKLGISVSDAEMQDLFFGTEPNAEIKKTFTNPQTGQFDPAAVKNYIGTLDRSVQGEDVVEKRTRWINFEKYVKEDRLQTKLRSLFRAGVYVPKWMAEATYNERNTKYNVDYVMIPLTTVPDADIKVTDEDLQAYINENKERFKQEETRKLEYVMFTVRPTQDDSAAALSYVNDAAAKLAQTEVDTNYVKMNADRSLENYYHTASSVPDNAIKDSLFAMPVGSVVGPVLANGAYYTAKIVDRASVPDSVKASHILFATQGATDTLDLKRKADSVFTAVQSGANFEELAKKYSADQGSAQKGGDLGWIKQGQTVKNFNQFLFFGGKVGETRMIKTEFGYHIVKVVTAPEAQPAVKYYLFSRPVEASTRTDKDVFGRANQFVSKNNNAAAFSAAVKANDNSYMRQTADMVRKSDFQLPGLENARELVAWSFRSEPGAVSPVFQSGNMYVIGHLVEANEAGTQSPAAARAQVEPIVRNRKKAEKLAQEIAAATQMNATLESIASQRGVSVQNAPAVDLAEGFVPGIGADPAFLGTLASLSQGQVSKPIAGNNGVYVVKVNSVTKPQPIADYTAIVQDQLRNTQPRIEFGITEALKKRLDVEDRRYNFF